MTDFSAPSRIIIASRQSRLALWQAEHVRTRLLHFYPQSDIQILGLSTTGDQILDKPLATIGGKGLFTKELERALEEGLAHLAVHSMKDVPMQLPQGFLMAAILQRENPADAFVSNRFASLEEMPKGARVGTSSVRRAALIHAEFPHLVVDSLRGNIDTRLKKLDEGDFDAIVLAAAGLIRLNWTKRIRAFLPTDNWLPAPGQGALGVEIFGAAFNQQIPPWLAVLNDAPSALCIAAERAFSAALNGSCQLPLGAFASLDRAGIITLRGLVANLDGSKMLRGVSLGKEPSEVGTKLAAELSQKGADQMLALLPNSAQKSAQRVLTT